ncbi:quinol:cytochrome c oxidoreductase pentaheme cytochrome subunit [Faunimonas pinastri]|uniref:Quinol:cytochrome c oxidoreductase pentaheme cytochrome subunit n=1 Tax=Faunimonas pinastri TaxID=1855383 RepID=A0A1H9LT25_9HYPH|nr:cytochrome c3 family protein [Faunimonas pinastri]SER14550.1 quinol:cytochrome c oxidoreductase pentaheme cytochrome subunit [Faunimonas pinastri]
MPQVFRPRANTIARLVLLAIVLLPAAGVALACTLVRSDYITRVGMAVNQPVPFSHQHHVAGLGLDCRYCHTGVENSAFAGVPPTHTCMTCHSQVWTNADILAPVRQSLAKDQPLRWNRVHNLPNYVYFDHSVHIAKGVGCTTCHGQIDQMPLTAKSASLQMQWCLDCHRDPAPNLRPKNEIFATDWNPPMDERRKQGHELLKAYGVDPSKLTDCSVCHR